MEKSLPQKNDREDIQKMKKRVVLLLAVLLSLTACSLHIGNKYDGPDAPKDENPPADAAPQEPAAPEDSVEPDIPTEPDIPAEPDVPAEPDEPAGSAPAGPEDAAGQRVIRTSHEDVTLFSAGETFRFTVWDSDGKDPDACTYTSADPAVASVDESGGEVTAVAPGTTTVTARVRFGDEEQEFSCIVRCSWEQTEDKEPGAADSGTAAGTLSLSEFFTTLQGRYEGLGAMMVLEGELLENYYPGLGDIAAVEEIYMQETMITMANVAVGLVRLSDSATKDDISAVQDILQSRIDTQANGGAWYPESCETWGKGVITSTSNVVGMFVYPDAAQEMADLFTASFSK